MESLKKIFFKNELEIEDLSYLIELLSINLPLSNCLELLKNKQNEKILTNIKDEMNKGVLIESAIQKYLPKAIKAYLLPLLKHLSFQEALSLSLSFYKKQKESEGEILKTILAPCLLLFVSMSALYLFDAYGLDSIFGLLKTFDSDIKVYEGIRVVIRIVIYIFYFGFMIVALLVLYFSREKHITFFYIVLSKYFPNSIFHTYFSTQFIEMLLICSERGYKTKEALEILKSIKNKPIISFLSFHIDEKLLEGSTLKEASKQAYYDISLSKYIKIAMLTNNFATILNSYIKASNEKIKRKMKKLTTTIQLATYILIGAIVIFIYQVLFLPMQAISNF